MLKTEDFKVVKIKIKDINTSIECLNIGDWREYDVFVEHCKDVMNAKLKYPIILAPNNFILDGRHRLTKAILKGKKYIKAVKFKKHKDLPPSIGE